MTPTIYLIGSLRNPRIPRLGKQIRTLGYDVFDEWHGAGPRADDEWQKYEQTRGRSYTEALNGLAAETIFKFDLKHLDRAHIGLLVLPAGKSAHLELGYMLGTHKIGIVLFEGEPARYDVMYKFAHHICLSEDELTVCLTGLLPTFNGGDAYGAIDRIDYPVGGGDVFKRPTA